MSKHLFKSRILTLLAITFFFCLFIISVQNVIPASPIFTPEEQKWIAKNTGEITLAPDPFWAPIEFFDNEGNYHGIAADYIKLIEKRSGLKFKIVRLEGWDSIVKALRRGSIDAVGGIHVSRKRKDFVNFSKPYIKIPNSIIVNRTDPGNYTLKDLKGKRVAIVKGYFLTDHIRKHYTGIKLIEVPDEGTGLSMIAFNNIDAMIVDIISASYHLEKTGITNLRIAGDTGYDYILSIGTRKGIPILINIINKTLGTISQREKENIYEKWVHLEHTFFLFSEDFRFITIGIILTIFALAAVILGWNLTLRRKIELKTEEIKKELADKTRAQSALSESEKKYRLLVETSQDLIWAMNPSFEWTYVNSACMSIYGFSPEEMIGKKVRDFTHPDYIEDYRMNMKKMISEGRKNINKFETIHIGKNKKPINLLFNTVILWDKNSNIEGYLGTASDISERVNMINTLKENERMLSTLMSNLPGIVYRSLYNQNWTMIFLNEGFRKLTGFEPDDFINDRDSSFAQLIHPDERERIWLSVTEAVNSNNPFEIIYRLRKKNNQYMWVWEKGRAVYKNGNFEFIEGIIEDITSLKNAEDDIRKLNLGLEQRVAERTYELKKSLEDLKAAQKQLIESEKMAALGSLVAGVAHEINTPVGIGVTAASYLREKTAEIQNILKVQKPDDVQLKKYFTIAEESTNVVLNNLSRASDLIGSFKQIAVDNANENRMRKFNLKEYLSEIILNLKHELKKNHISLEYQCPGDIILDNYPGIFSQIFTNLIMNSMIHAFNGQSQREIKIDVSRNGSELLIDYRDNGRGIPEENIDRIFDPFFSTREDEGGTGLGLNIVYNLVNYKLNGNIQCYSRENEGTGFQIKLQNITVQ